MVGHTAPIKSVTFFNRSDATLSLHCASGSLDATLRVYSFDSLSKHYHVSMIGEGHKDGIHSVVSNQTGTLVNSPDLILFSMYYF